MVGEKREEKRKRNLSVFSTNRENVGTQGKLYLIFHTVSTTMRAIKISTLGIFFLLSVR